MSDMDLKLYTVPVTLTVLAYSAGDAIATAMCLPSEEANVDGTKVTDVSNVGDPVLVAVPQDLDA